MFNIFQILFIIFTVVAVGSVVNRYQNNQLSNRGLVFWVLFWLLALGIVLFPDTTLRLANAVGIGRGSDFVIYISVIVMFFVLFRLHVKLETMNRDITKVVRGKAIENVSSNKKK